MLILLRPLLVSHRHPFPGQFPPRKLPDAGDDVIQRRIRIHRQKPGAVVARNPGRPRIRQTPQMNQQQIRRRSQVIRPPIGVGVVGIILRRTAAGAVFVQILPPEQELNRVPAGRNVLFPALFVQRLDQGGVNHRKLLRVVDNPRRRVARHIVDIGFVHRPGIQQPLRPILLVVNGAAVKPESLGRPVIVPSDQPSPLRRLQRRRRRIRQENVNGDIHRPRRRQTLAVQRINPVGVVRNHLPLQLPDVRPRRSGRRRRRRRHWRRRRIRRTRRQPRDQQYPRNGRRQKDPQSSDHSRSFPQQAICRIRWHTYANNRKYVYTNLIPMSTYSSKKP